MRRRLRCMWHQESTPSLVQRKGFWRCYGACHRTYTNEEVEARTGEHYEYVEENEEKEDLKEEFEYINSLPKKVIRGLSLPCDERGYYIVFGRDEYYKYRLFNPGKGSKYLSAKGHYPPLFWARRSPGSTLCVVEGELNAMSVALAYEEYAVCSPGSASMFNADNLSKYLTEFKQYSNLIVILDDDPAGIKAYIEAKAFFLYKVPFVTYLRMKPDANDVLNEKGPKGLREALQRADRR